MDAAKETAPVPDICPLDRYDSTRAKTRASLSWLLSRTRGPEDGAALLSEGDGLCVELESLLRSCDLYRRLFSSATALSGFTPPADDCALLQLLHRHQLLPLHPKQHTPLQETQLRHKPIDMEAHLALIDSLMSLSVMETMSRVKMAKEVGGFEGGTSWEKSLLFWINKVNQKMRENPETEEQKHNTCRDLQPVQHNCPQRWYWKLVPHAIAFCLKESGNKPPVIRYRKDKVQSGQGQVFALASGLKDLSNGCAIAAALHFYCPQILPLDDVCLKDAMSLTDSVYNLQLIKDFCETHLKSCFPLQLEDMLYAPRPLQVNLMCFLSELFSVFEVEKPEFVKPVHTLDLTDASDLLDCTSPIVGNSGSPSLVLKQSVLSRSPSDERCWSKKQIGRPLSAVSFSIPFPLDSDVDVVMGNPLFRSVSTDSLTKANNPGLYTPPEDLSKLIGQAPLGELPTIDEAFQITHSVHTEPRLRPEGAPSGFFLHGSDECETRLSSSAPCRSGMMCQAIDSKWNLRGGKRLPPIIVDDMSEDLYTKSSSPTSGQKVGRMTNFAERRKKMPESPAHRESPQSTGMSLVGTEAAQELGERLEEKRKAIEAQKRRIEAIFIKHRQRLGKTAFLKLQKKPGEETEDEHLPLEERLTQMENQIQQEEEKERKEEEEKKAKDEQNNSCSVAPAVLEKQLTFSVKAKSEVKEPPLEEYNEAVAKLNSTLQTLQRDMQQLTEQQQRLMGKKPHNNQKNSPSNKTSASSKAWIIPSASKPTTPAHLSRDPTCVISPSGSPSRAKHLTELPSRSPKSSASRRPCATVSKSPRHQRPSRPTDLGFQPLTRVLTPPQSVDTLPHLRRVSPSKCQVQTSSSLRLGGPCTPLDSPPHPVLPQESTPESACSDHHTPIFTLELEPEPEPEPGALSVSKASVVGSSGSECSFESELVFNSGPLNDEPTGTLEDDTDLEQGLEIFSSDSTSDQTESENRLGLEIVFKDEGLSEQDMAQKKALLLKRQQRRAEEIKRRKCGQGDSLQSSLDDLRLSPAPALSQSLPTSCIPPPLQATPPGTPLRQGSFTRTEYQRRQQLKIMADLDKVLKQSPAKHGSKKPHKVLPHARSPAKTAALIHQKNIGTSSTDKPASHSDLSPKLKSSVQQTNQNGEKDNENVSNASSPASIPEYTGPKLFKEPSFKSNKFIIQSALSRCCLAGKVNESQKNKIIKEMEKSSASHFLILLRDSSCQFRGIYTMDPQTEQLHRLCGVGPRAISSLAVEAIYKYSSDRKEFNTLPSHTFSMSVDAFTLPAQIWHSKKPGTPKKSPKDLLPQ